MSTAAAAGTAIVGSLMLGTCALNFNARIDPQNGTISVVSTTPTPTPTPTAPAVPSADVVARLKVALASGAPRQVMPTDPATVSSSQDNRTLTGPGYAKNDQRIRILNSQIVTSGFYDPRFIYTKSATYSGYPNYFVSGTNAIEFTMTGNSFERETIGIANQTPWSVEIDGVATNANGYAPPPRNRTLSLVTS